MTREVKTSNILFTKVIGLFNPPICQRESLARHHTLTRQAETREDKHILECDIQTIHIIRQERSLQLRLRRGRTIIFTLAQ